MVGRPAAGGRGGVARRPGRAGQGSGGVLTPAEQAAILWARPPRSFKSARWSAADAVLVDEVAGLLERPRGYGHVIVDEAQDLSAMQCRAIARRSEHGSITVLGDLAQGTTPWAARGWREQLGHLGRPRAELIALTLGFRVPAAVVAMANRLLETLAADVPETRSFRADGRLRIREAPDLARATVAAVREALDHEGSIAVMAADATLERLTTALRAQGVAVATLDDPASDAPAARVTAVPAAMAKGLEYDHVVVAELPRSSKPRRGDSTGSTSCSPGPSRVWTCCTPGPCRPRSSRGSKPTASKRDARLRGRAASLRRAIGQADGDTARPVVPAVWRMISRGAETV
ncbi:hypothetical protein ACFQX6_17685 [Streptosporangium lutulentum]